MNRTRPLTRAGQYLALLAYLLFLGYPLLWLVSISLKGARELASIHPSLIPRSLVWDNYRIALTDQGLLRSALNSVLTSVGATVIVIVVSVPAAYALTRFRNGARTAATLWILISQVFPTILIVIPLFLLLKSFGLLDSLPGLTVVYVVWTLPFALWMLMGYMASVPQEVEEAAAVDGAGRFRVVFSVVLPLLTPGIVATAMFAFISAWNEFFFALVLISTTEKRTLALTLAKYVGSEGQLQLGPLAAGSVLATVPSLVFFLFLQKRLSGGLLAGAVKG
ncbi:carbohydrate ABC transporter permease [Nakamurella endophytica]|uniref:Sugar ABC transporter permease n=1 Tax=Nakamurella endophytica TaxID=1748367 RepID=A0A917T8S1_9ACTN|nr:carbohydrate ABC transporter permease [Nakamurella endophytica]GGM13840.1 sugar ABC transporter permease [Nakamurella endophytica]